LGGTICRWMPFFLILPLWFGAVLVGAVMIGVRSARRVGVYVVTMSTLALIVSFVLSYAVLFGLTLIAPQPAGWFAFVVLGGYFIAIPIGGVIGAAAGFLLTHKLLRTHRSSTQSEHRERS